MLVQYFNLLVLVLLLTLLEKIFSQLDFLDSRGIWYIGAIEYGGMFWGAVDTSVGTSMILILCLNLELGGKRQLAA